MSHLCYMEKLLEGIEVDLLKSQEINLDYILQLVFEYNKKVNNKAELVGEVRRLIRTSLGQLV